MLSFFSPPKVRCKYCQNEFNPTELNAKVKSAKERVNPLVAEGKSYSCSQCGMI